MRFTQGAITVITAIGGLFGVSRQYQRDTRFLRPKTRQVRRTG
jgi:hypothetical protein